MKGTILTFAICLLGLTFCTAQKIESQKVFRGYKFTQNGNRMTMGDLISTMESNTESLGFMKKARTNATISSIISGAGGFLIGWPIGTSLGGGDANWTLAGIGAGLVVVAIPISSGANKNAKKAVDLYNSTLDSTSYREFNPDFKIIANGNGIGLAMKF